MNADPTTTLPEAAPHARHASISGGDPADPQASLNELDHGPNTLDATIVLPCYNEGPHVLLELERITKAMDASGFRYELLVIDDKSTDNTLQVLQEALPRFPRMRLMPFQRNGGSGTARRIGSAEAYGRIVVWTDSDMTYPNERIPEFIQYLIDHPETDQVVGARTTEQGTHKVLRVPAKWVIRKVAETLAGTKIPDLNSGLRAFRRDVSLPYLRLLPPGFSCVTTITLSFLSNQHTVDYLPIDYAKRAGTSKFHFVRDAYRYILQVLRMVMYFNPIKVLMPLALVLLGVGVTKAIVDVIIYFFRITTNSLLLIVTGLLIASVALLADLIVRSRAD
ncbi:MULTISPECIES: glycosyltransferase family 2 protein [Cryptosporangium]|uniref:Glycosyl transferase n=1 Tax=Cryptosporangium arvum DSM 44712 TaxID=927661 RepID=A0A011ACU9_9ACTN|nr:glycosyltransferase family 2 protein [Cryptosporangium arvum]EXG79876.1 glycosyl transferase [Cryptosporangium arvum DSM 44712]